MVRKEILTVAKIVSEMASELSSLFHEGNLTHLTRMGEDFGKVEYLNNAIIAFLAKLSQEELSRKESNACMNFIHIQHELTSIGDLMDKNISALMNRKIEMSLSFSREGFRELEQLIGRIGENLNSLYPALSGENPDSVQSILEAYRAHEEEKYKAYHIDRLHRGLAETISTSALHLELITYFSRINGHIYSIARRIRRGMS